MPVIRRIRVNGAEYDLVRSPQYSDHFSMYEAVVRRPSGEEARAYSRTPSGPFVFKTPVNEHPRTIPLTVIRHGATALNAESGGPDRLRGWSEVPLSDVGEKEVSALGRELSDSGIKCLYYSDLIRTTQTAQELSRATGARMIPVFNLRPWNVGIFTGQKSSEATPLIHDYARHTPNVPITGGESFNQFRTRVFKALKEILGKAGYEKVGIVTHHRVERLTKSWIAAGQQPDMSVDFSVMFHKGEKPATAETVTIDTDALSNVAI